MFFDKIKFDLDNKQKDILYANIDGLSFIEHFTGPEITLEGWKPDLDEHKRLEIENIKKQYGDGKAFQTCFLLFNKYLIEQNYFEKLYNDYLVNYCYHELARTKWWDQTMFNTVFYKKWESLGEEYINRNPVMDNIHWKFEELEDGYYDDTDYSDTIALHFFHLFQPWNKNNLRFYPIWKEYNDKF
jgi:lipopolysaccharide biosynthesis glycosyltransferase